MPRLYLDSAGEDVLVAWFMTHPAFDDMDLVQDVLDTYAAGEPVGGRWHTARDLITGDLIVSPREGVTVVIRRFSDTDPEYQFTLIAVESESIDIDP